MNLTKYSIELLNDEEIRSVIDRDNLFRLSRLDIFDSIDSTNSYLLAQAKKNAPSGSVCFAEQQTQGRGRFNRKWFSPHATNIYCSLLWRFADLKNISGLSIAVGVIIIETLKKYGIVSGLELKWPNDILFEKRKLSGILLECNDQSGVVIGIGLNLYLPKMKETKHWIALHEITGRHAPRNYIAGLLVNELLLQLPLYQTRGLNAFLPVWQEHDVLYGKSITVYTADREFLGMMRGINERGELILQHENGEVQSFCYGEVSIKT